MVGAARYTPQLSSVIKSFMEDLLELKNVLLDACIVFPSQKEYGNTCIRGSICLGIKKHSRVLEVSGEGLEVGTLRRSNCILGRWQRIVIVANLRRLRTISNLIQIGEI